MARVGPDMGGEFPAEGTSDGTQLETDVDAYCGAGPSPVPGLTADGHGLDRAHRERQEPFS